MSDLLGIVRLGLDAGRQRLEAIGLNAANAARPGYRRAFALDAVTLDAPAGGLPSPAAGLRAAAAPVAARAAEAGQGPQAGSAGLVRHAGDGGQGPDGVHAAARAVDLRPGEPIATGRALDLAIEGDELFFALTDGGAPG